MEIMGVTLSESTNFATYQLQGVAYTYFKYWKEDRGVEESLVYWDRFVTGFRDRFFPINFRMAKVQDFINLK